MLSYYCAMILFGILLGTREVVIILIQILPRSMNPFPQNVYVLQHGRTVTSANFFIKSSFCLKRGLSCCFVIHLKNMDFYPSPQYDTFPYYSIPQRKPLLRDWYESSQVFFCVFACVCVVHKHLHNFGVFRFHFHYFT